MFSFICSRCDHPNASGRAWAAGSCETCADGSALCEKCMANHAAGLAKFSGHVFAATTQVAPGEALLDRLGITPAPKACARHGQSLSGLVCTACPDVKQISNLCLACIREHVTANPGHAFVKQPVDVAEIRSAMDAAAKMRVEGCFAPTAFFLSQASRTGVTGDGNNGAAPGSVASSEEPPLLPATACGRHKAAAVIAELDALRPVEAAAIEQLEANRDAIIARTHALFTERVAAVQAAAAAKRERLETELVTADAALEAAQASGDALLEVGGSVETERLKCHWAGGHRFRVRALLCRPLACLRARMSWRTVASSLLGTMLHGRLSTPCLCCLRRGLTLPCRHSTRMHWTRLWRMVLGSSPLKCQRLLRTCTRHTASTQSPCWPARSAPTCTLAAATTNCRVPGQC